MITVSSRLCQTIIRKFLTIIWTIYNLKWMFLLWCNWFPNTLFERWVLLLHKQSYQYDFHTIRYCVKSKRPYFSNNINTVCVAKWHSFTWVFPIYFELLMTYDTLLLMSVLSSHFDNFAIILGLHLQVSIRLYALFM